MGAEAGSTNSNSAADYAGTPDIPMQRIGGNSPFERAKVIFLGTKNHYDRVKQSLIAGTFKKLTRHGDVVLTEGESNTNGRLSRSWIPEMGQVNTGQVTLLGWEEPGLYARATDIVRNLSAEIQLFNSLSGSGLGLWVMPLLGGLKRRIDSGMAKMEQVVLHDRTRAMKQSVMSALGRRLTEENKIVVYAGMAHVEANELGGMNGLPYAVYGV